MWRLSQLLRSPNPILRRSQIVARHLTTADPLALSLVAARDAIAASRISSQQIVAACLDQVERTSRLNVFITPPDRVKLTAAALDSDARVASKQARPLEGVPIAIKDNFCTDGTRTTAASHMLHSLTPPYNATVVARLLDAGALLFGKTNMDEFGMGYIDASMIG